MRRNDGRGLRLEDRGVKALQPQDRSPNEREAHQPAAPTHARRHEPTRGHTRYATCLHPRRSSTVAVSGDRSKKAASFLTARMWSRCVAGVNPRRLMSSSMRWRSGLMGFSLIGAPVLRLECFDPSILKTESPPVIPAQSAWLLSFRLTANVPAAFSRGSGFVR